MRRIEDSVKSESFYKHKDYEGECEFKICQLFNDKNCIPQVIKGELAESSMMLDVSDCLLAIIVSSYANYKQKDELLKYANSMDMPIIEIIWKHNSFEIKDYRLLRGISDNLWKNNK